MSVMLSAVLTDAYKVEECAVQQDLNMAEEFKAAAT